MNNRVVFQQAQPAAVKALIGLDTYLQTPSLTKIQKELIKIRASQINGCAYCINMHTKDARKLGETEQRIYALNAWRDTDFFTPQEQAILALTEEITLISKGGVSNETYQNAAVHFTETEIAEIMMAVISINAWNRVAIPTHMKPALDAAL